MPPLTHSQYCAASLRSTSAGAEAVEQRFAAAQSAWEKERASLVELLRKAQEVHGGLEEELARTRTGAKLKQVRGPTCHTTTYTSGTHNAPHFVSTGPLG